MTRVTIDPITRLEGHGRIEIFLDDRGDVANAYFQVPELRGFEQFCVGRQAEDMPNITNRICGVCPEAHHMAAAKALDELFDVEPPRTAHLLRELLYMAFFVTDHTTHFYALAGPDFIVGLDAPPAERNLLGVVRKVGLDVGRDVIACRARNHAVIEKLGGRGIHLVGGLPGGWSCSIDEAQRAQIEQAARQNIDFALFSLRLFHDVVLGNPVYRDVILGDTYLHRTYYMGTVDAGNRPNFYDGQIRVVDPDGRPFARYAPRDYARHVTERSEPWTYLKIPYLREIGWKGYVDGPDSGVYVATPLARLNVADGMATPLAQAEYVRFYETFGGARIDGRYRPVHQRMATHWARLIELLYASERMLELSLEPDVTGTEVRRLPSGKVRPHGGVGSVEAPRGTLTHHYVADERAILRSVNLIVGTTNNYAAMSMSIKRAAEKLINGGRAVTDALLNQVEMAFRLYDPCLSCATHTLPGQMPLKITIRDASGRIATVLRRD